MCQLIAKRWGLAQCLAYTNSLNICCLTKWTNISCTSGERDFLPWVSLYLESIIIKTIWKTSAVCYNEICILFKTILVTIPTVMVTKPYSFSFPTAFYTSRFFSCHFLANPSLLIFIHSVSPSNTKVILMVQFIPHCSPWNIRAHFLPCHPASRLLLPTFRDTFTVRASSLALLWTLLKFKSLVMTVEKSLPLSRSLCPHLWEEALGLDGL